METSPNSAPSFTVKSLAWVMWRLASINTQDTVPSQLYEESTKLLSYHKSEYGDTKKRLPVHRQIKKKNKSPKRNPKRGNRLSRVNKFNTRKCGLKYCSKPAQNECAKQAMRRGLCTEHGGGYKYKCAMEDCTKQAQKYGLCTAHGGVVQIKKCDIEDCTRRARRHGLCTAHGGAYQKTCTIKECSKRGLKDLSNNSDLKTNMQDASLSVICEVSTEQPDESESEDTMKNLTEADKDQIFWQSYHKTCTVEDCSKQAHNNGLCRAHGGGFRKASSVEDCPEQVWKSGTYQGHSTGLTKTCGAEGCHRRARTAGLCREHLGSKCPVDECHKMAKKGGLCPDHGGTYFKKECSLAECHKLARKGGLCASHGGGCHKKKCVVESCTKQSQKRGLCAKHGGCVWCSVENCTKQAQKKGLCIAHGGGVNCSVENCTRQAQKRGLCNVHESDVRCSAENCTKLPQKRGLCIAHGGGVRNGGNVLPTAAVLGAPLKIVLNKLRNGDFVHHMEEVLAAAWKTVLGSLGKEDSVHSTEGDEKCIKDFTQTEVEYYKDKGGLAFSPRYQARFEHQMEDCVYDSEIKDTEMERTCEVFIKQENITEYEMELNPLEFVSVAVKSEVVDSCEPDSPSDEPSVERKDEKERVENHPLCIRLGSNTISSSSEVQSLARVAP
uniref:WRKY19-like zinc finger domain-containing protein n=1 Tax=Timema douglasi TaxID=61478 RepID=A0A7R8VKL3_TIMDO|nr:unnamed protein product [Timema douglasi]